MAGIAARTHITAMQHANIAWNRTVCQYPRQAMTAQRQTGDSQPPIAARQAPGPQPAIISSGNDDIFVKTGRPRILWRGADHENLHSRIGRDAPPLSTSVRSA